MRFYSLSFLSLLIILLVSCRKDFDFEPHQSGQLSFSKDTVYLDTVFTNIGSSTYMLKVYNRSNKNIKIPQLQLAQGEKSHYRLLVDGQAGKVFQNVELLAKDSMFIFIETTIDYNQFKNQSSEYLYTDQIKFGNGSGLQQVELVTLVKDAHFLYPQRNAEGITETLPFDDEEIYGFYLSEANHNKENTLHWKNDKPYVIYGYAAVPSTKTLQIDEGAKIHFHSNSGLLVANKATVLARGTIEKPIQIQGDRLEPEFANIPGQWGAIWLTVGSTGTFENTIIKNPTVGLLINKNTETVQLHNVQIYNASQNGILGRAAKIYGTNVVVGNAGSASLACTFGGEYEFLHSSFVNYWNKPNHTAVSIDDYDGSAEFQIVKALFENCILYSSATESLLMRAKSSPENFKIHFKNSLIKYFSSGNGSTNFPYDFNNPSRFSAILLSTGTDLYRPYFYNISKNELMITDQSVDIIGKGNLETAQKVPFDLSGKARNISPDLGAYQNVTSPKE
ncbi:hypothetical protein [Flavobacterium sp. NKUCC04_CG]|uniref:hypothetical protein n=1 Tax=Flavobacterium sp. NKUCC04_CG TaxID=2842121 RepID=UPI001C5BF99A|nr:hypothetical protein [Flavobacterium sp. NKUCC04_CG]MBW3519636.1 hypothetical protein [Flavobacterium sp. NKUCC04_CG]